MKDASFMIPKPSLLQEAVIVLDKIDNEENDDIQGDIYEYLLGELRSAGKNGQFRTPRHIIRMMIDLINPDINEKICDPACGTAGFLVTAYQHILKKYTSENYIITDEDGVSHNLIGDKIDNKQWNTIRNDMFFGFDFEISIKTF
jgi:type I restriction enzyme M protein